MTQEEVRARSAEKVKQVQSLMGVLKVRVEAHQRINQQGILENVVFYIDDETYPLDSDVKVEPETVVPVENLNKENVESTDIREEKA